MEIKEFDKPTIRAIRPNLEAALHAIAEQYGVKVEVGNASFTPNNVTFKVILSVVGDSGAAVTREVEDFIRYAPLFGFQKDDLGKTFSSRGKTFKIVGWMPKRRKFPVLAEDESGKKILFVASDVLRLLGRTPSRFTLPDDLPNDD